jgi:hypothetical protein
MTPPLAETVPCCSASVSHHSVHTWRTVDVAGTPTSRELACKSITTDSVVLKMLPVIQRFITAAERGSTKR